MDSRTRAALTRSPREIDLAQHRRKCSVCRHPEREAIEDAFLHWQPIASITNEFKLPGRTAIYRHAHALDLFERRSRNLQFPLGLIIEQANHVTPTAHDIIDAVKLFTQIDDSGRWIGPIARVIHSSATGSTVDELIATHQESTHDSNR